MGRKVLDPGPSPMVPTGLGALWPRGLPFLWFNWLWDLLRQPCVEPGEMKGSWYHRIWYATETLPQHWDDHNIQGKLKTKAMQFFFFGGGRGGVRSKPGVIWEMCKWWMLLPLKKATNSTPKYQTTRSQTVQHSWHVLFIQVKLL